MELTGLSTVLDLVHERKRKVKDDPQDFWSKQLDKWLYHLLRWEKPEEQDCVKKNHKFNF